MLRRLSASVNGVMSAVGLVSDEKKIQAAITSDDEEKALALLTVAGKEKSVATSSSSSSKTDSFPKSLCIHPSMPFEGTKHEGNTALHLATEYAMRKLVDLFLEYGGNPNMSNSAEQTALHTLCNQSSHAEERLHLLETLLVWKSCGHNTKSQQLKSSECDDYERVSVNRVDADGCTAMHYAAEKGLMPLVQRLVAAGGIISIVNKAQRTCCELAEAQGHHQLSSMLELALIFQPADKGMEAFDVTFDGDGTAAGAGNALPPLYVLDCSSKGMNDTEDYMTRLLDSTCGLMKQPVERVETLLAQHYDWDADELLRAYQENPEAVLEAAKLDPSPLSLAVAMEPQPSLAMEKEDENIDTKEVKEDEVEDTEGKESVDKIYSKESQLELELELELEPPTPPEQQVLFVEAEALNVTSVSVSVNPPPVPEDMDFMDYDKCEDLKYLQEELKRIKKAGDIAAAIAVEDAIERLQSANVDDADADAITDSLAAVVVQTATIEKAVAEDIAKATPVNEAEDRAITIRELPELPPDNLVYFSESGEISAIPTEVLHDRAASLVKANDAKDARQAQAQARAQSEDWAQAQVHSRENEGDSEEGEAEDCPICCEAMVREADFDTIMGNAVKQMENEGKGESELCVRNHDSSRGKCLTCRADHKFCISCWCQHVTSKVRDESFADLTCPGYKCGETLNMKWAPFLLQDSEPSNSSANRRRLSSSDVGGAGDLAMASEVVGLLGRFRRARISRFIDCNRSCQNCPTLNCGLVLLIQPGQMRTGGNGAGATNAGDSGSVSIPQVALCAAGHSLCLLCRQEGHAPCTCSQWEQWQVAVRKQLGRTDASEASGSATDMANALWLSANTKKCPRCSTGIEKDEGCNHMVCSKCRHEFCWMCMEKWSLHSNSTGGYFQCNKFKDKEGMDDGDGDGDLDGSTAYDDRYEKGSSRAESLRLKMSGRCMARFIHHFTRYSAHADSARREALMRLETLQRIEYTLYRSATGDLHWLHTGLVTNPAEENLKRLPSMSGAASTSTPQKSSTGCKSVNMPQTPERGASSLDTSSASPKAGGLAAKMNKAVTSLSKWFSPSKTSAIGNSSGKNISQISEADAAYAATNFTQDADALVPSAANGVNGGNSTVPYLTDGPSYLTFLRDGFDELARARQLLRGTYVQAYFLFDAKFYHTMKNWRRQSRIMELQSVYEALQGELEFLVEMLSDVLARRRLRASQFQVKQLLFSVRSKRIEMEGSILNTIVGAMADEDSLAVPPGMTSLSSNGSLGGRNNRGSGTVSGRRGGSGSSRNNTGVRPLLSDPRAGSSEPYETYGNGSNGGLNDAELAEMLGLVSQLDLQREASGDRDTEVAGLIGRSMQVLRENGYVLDIPVGVGSANDNDTSSNNVSNTHNTGQRDGSTTLAPAEAAPGPAPPASPAPGAAVDSDSDEEEHAARPLRVRGSPRSSPVRNSSNRTPGSVIIRPNSSEIQEPRQPSGSDDESDNSDADADADEEATRENRDLEEMQLQSALLMSLHQEPTFSPSAEQASAENIGLLVSMMEISEARAAEALMSNGHNVEAAINSLLS